MGNTKWTPGPYERTGTTVYALNEQGINRSTAQVQPGWRWKAGTGISSDDRRTTVEEQEATAQLFTAAPDLYDALEAIVTHPAYSEMEDGDGNPCNLIADGLAALAKACGEAPAYAERGGLRDE